MKVVIVWSGGEQMTTMEAKSVCPPNQGCLAYMVLRGDGVTYLERADVRSVSTYYTEESHAEDQAR